MMPPQVEIARDSAGQRLDVVLAKRFPKYSRSFLQQWVKAGKVTLKGRAPAVNYLVRIGDVFDVVEPSTASQRPEFPADTGKHEAAAEGPSILFEDDAILVINKPAGLVAHPAPSYHGLTLTDWLRTYLGGKVVKIFTDPERLGLVHRLDKETSGVLVIAKSVEAQTALARQFHDRLVQKTYAAFIEGVPSSAKGVISAPVGRSRKQRGRMAVSGSGRPSETVFEVVETFREEAAHVALYPKTGRTHQLRVHLAAIGHTILGDTVYGSNELWRRKYGITRTLLHAERLALNHPLSAKRVEYKAPWPDDFKRARTALRHGALAAALLFICTIAPAHAEPESSGSSAATSESPAPRKPVHHAAPSSGATSAAAVRALKKEIASLKEQLDNLRQQVAALQNSMDQLNGPERLNELEHAVPDINAKAVSSAAAVEEIKSSTMDSSRKLKGQQEAIDELRNQVSRLKTDVIQLKTQREAAPPSAPVPVDGAGKNP